MPEELNEEPQSNADPDISDADSDLLKEIREDFQYFTDYWKENREQMAEDSQYAACNFWSADDLKDREGRPSLCPDELSQYVKQYANSLRQNKRAGKVDPRGMGATDQDAHHRQTIIRGIEHASTAQAAYTTAYEQAAWTGLGFWRVTTVPTGNNKEVHPAIKRIPNQFTVLLDPEAREADFSDARKCFVTDVMRTKAFTRKFKNAKKRSFSAQDMNVAPGWLNGDDLVIAEYWKGDEGRPGTDMKVMQYITDGFEILERTEWAGSFVPIIPVVGEEIYVNEGGRSKRVFLSLIRRARTPQKMLAYIASQEQEEFAMAPRAPLQGFEGQFDPDEHGTLHKTPRAYVEFKVPKDWNAGWGVPPLPGRTQFMPNAQAYELASERWRRGIQAAMGITPLPTAAQRQNEKSGIALDKIQTQEAIGSFHITDNFDRALANSTRQLNELITRVMDTPRQVGVRKPDETHSLLWVTTSEHSLPPEAQEAIKSQDDYLVTDRGEFDVTISAGPNVQSEREEASNFADTFISYVSKLPVPPQIQMHLIGLAVKLKNVGPIGEEIAKLLIPPDADKVPPEAQAAIAQAQGIIQQLQAELQKLQIEKQGKVIDNEYKLQMNQLNNDIKVLTALITAKSQREDQEYEMYRTFWLENHNAAHERGMQAEEHTHEKDTLAKQAEIASAQAAQQHAQTLEQNAQQAAQPQAQ